MIKDWAQSGQTFHWRGHRVFFRTEGYGPALLLIHGLPTASWIWHGMWGALAGHSRLIAPDLIGFGLSDKPRTFDYTVMSQADLCEALLTHLEVTDFHVLAEDYGDTVAQELLARSPAGRIASVCLLNGGIFPEAHRPPLAQRLMDTRLTRPLTAFVMRRPFQRGLSRLFGPGTKPAAATLEALWQLLCHNDGPAILPRLMAYRADRHRHRDRWVNALVRSRIPRLLIAGARDPVCGRAMIDLWRAQVAGGELVELPEVGHFPALEAPDAVVRAYRAFRRRHAPSTHPPAGVP